MKTILIVEDETIISDPLTKSLQKYGFKVVVAKNGEEGLEAAESVKPDLMLIDLIMPVMGGLTLLKELRETLWGKNIPAFVLTNLDDRDMMQKAEEFGVRGYFVKSNWKIDDIIDTVKQETQF